MLHTHDFIVMLSPHFSTMSEQEFTSLPTSTIAVESHNRLSKHDKAEILCVALLTTYNRCGCSYRAHG